MNERTRDYLLWLIWVLVVAVVLCVMAKMCLGADVPPVPNAIVVRPVNTNRYYFAATAKDTNGESAYSNEASVPTTNKPMTVVVAWDASPSSNVTYTVYQGTNSGAYTNTVNCGTNLTASVTILPKVWITVLTFSMTNLPSLVLTNPQGSLLVRGRAWKVFNNQWPTVMEGRSLYPPSAWATLSGPVTNTSKPILSVRVTRSQI